MQLFEANDHSQRVHQRRGPGQAQKLFYVMSTRPNRLIGLKLTVLFSRAFSLSSLLAGVVDSVNKIVVKPNCFGNSKHCSLQN